MASAHGKPFIFSDLKHLHDVPDASGPGVLAERDFLGQAASHVLAPLEVPGFADAYQLRPSISNFLSASWNAIQTSAVTLSRSVLDQESWFREDYYMNEDLELWPRLIDRSVVVFVPDVLSYYRKHDNSITTEHVGFYESMVQLHGTNYETHTARFSAEERRSYRHRIAEFYFDLAWAYDVAGRTPEARSSYLCALPYQPRISTALAFAKTFLPDFLRGSVGG